MWQIDFTYFKIIGWGWMYLSTILGDFSRYIINWKLWSTIKTSDVPDTLNMALQASGCDQANVVHKPRLLSDNSSSYISEGLADYIKDQGTSEFLFVSFDALGAENTSPSVILQPRLCPQNKSGSGTKRPHLYQSRAPNEGGSCDTPPLA